MYTRPPEIEEAIREALELEWRELVSRAEIRDAEDPGFIPPEVLIFLLRAALAAGQRDAADTLGGILFGRVERLITNYAWRLVEEMDYRVEEVTGDLLAELFTRLSDLQSDRADFAQVKFGMYLQRFCFENKRKLKRQSGYDKRTRIIGETDPETDIIFDIPDREPVCSQEDLETMREGLNDLPEQMRKAFVLRYYEGWQVESNKPEEVTISGYFKKTPRTIRNWLTEAERRLRERLEGRGG